MKRTYSNLIWGALLILAGVVFLLQSFGFINLNAIWGGFWALAFLVAGLAFLIVFLRDNEQWWALIPGFSLLGLGTLVGLGLINDALASKFGAPLFLGAIGLGFWAVYLVRRENWWAIIPGGVLFSIAAMIGLEPILGDTAMVGVMFLGMALTFVLVALLPNPHGRMSWAFIPAGVLLILGVFMTAGSMKLLAILGPLALIVGGGFLLFRNALVK